MSKFLRYWSVLPPLPAFGIRVLILFLLNEIGSVSPISLSLSCFSGLRGGVLIRLRWKLVCERSGPRHALLDTRKMEAVK